MTNLEGPPLPSSVNMDICSYHSLAIIDQNDEIYKNERNMGKKCHGRRRVGEGGGGGRVGVGEGGGRGRGQNCLFTFQIY